MKPIISFIALLLLFLIVPFVHADDPVDNWCDPGGVWGDGRCNSGDEGQNSWFYTCGWYMAQLDRGEIGRFDVSSQCNSVLPPVTLPELTSLPPAQLAVVCKTFPEIANSTACAGIDQSGTIDVASDGVIDSWALFVTSMPCATPASMPPLIDSMETSTNAYWSDAAFAPINLNAYSCIYSNVSP